MSDPAIENTRADWNAAAEQLADWAINRAFVRTDRFGGYYRKGGETQKSARPNEGCTEPFSRAIVVRHFKAARTSDVIGAYPLTAGAGGAGKWIGIDIDAHDESDDLKRNGRYARHLFAKLKELGFQPLLLTWGKGGYHLLVYFASDVPGAVLHSFGRWLVTDAQSKPWDFAKPVESFPKQAVVKNVGNFLRLVGRHHTRDTFAAVFNGETFVHGAEAVRLILACTGDTAELIPDEARAKEVKMPPRPLERDGMHRDRGDVFAEFNRRNRIDDVVGWHQQHGHRVTNAGPHRVELTRAGKDGTGQSFNVVDRGGAAITYCFSTNAGMPDHVGLTAAQVACFYQCGACDAAAMSRFAENLRTEYGWSKPAREFSKDVSVDPLADERFRETDLANAKRFVFEHGHNIRFVADWNRWCCWDGMRWAVDRSGGIVAGLAHQTLRRMADAAVEKMMAAAKAIAAAAADDEEAQARAKKEKAAAERELEWAKRSQDVKRVSAMLKMSEPYVLVHNGCEVFDTHPHLLTCPNGTVDLRTGEMRPHAQLDMLTRLCPTEFDPRAAAPTYLTFLAAAIPDPAIAGYIREVSGYAVTGEVSDQTVHLFHGPGSNGKGVLLDLWVDVLGDGEYAITAPAELIADNGENRHPTEKTVLRGARLAVCQETADDEKLNAKRVKHLTGGSRITARGMKQDFFTFMPTHTLILATNHLPRVRATDHATWRRLRVAEFGVVFWTDADRKAKPDGEYPEHRRADADLPAKLRAEAKGVFADMVAHAAEFYANGRRLQPPATVMKSVAEYRNKEDVIAQFLSEWQADTTGMARVKGGEFYGQFTAWYKLEIDPNAKDCPGQWSFGTAAKAAFGNRTINGKTIYRVVRRSEPVEGTGRGVEELSRNPIRRPACARAREGNPEIEQPPLLLYPPDGDPDAPLVGTAS